MLLSHAYNATSAREAGIACCTCADDVFALELCELETPNGSVIRARVLECTLYDIVRDQRIIGIQIVAPAMQP